MTRSMVKPESTPSRARTFSGFRAISMRSIELISWVSCSKRALCAGGIDNPIALVLESFSQNGILYSEHSAIHDGRPVTMSEPFVAVSREGAVGVLTLNRPPANSYNMDFVHQLSAAVDQVGRDAEIRVVVVKSALEKFFCAGADVKFFSEGTQSSNMDMIRAEHAALERIGRVPKVFIAMLGGHALGGGLEIALACDLRFAGDGDFKLGLPEVTLGLLPGNGGTQRLPRLIGRSRALDLMVNGRAVSPAEALALGMVDRVFPQPELASKTLEYATNLTRGASFAVGRIKLAVNEGIEMPLGEGLAHERKMTEQVFLSEDAKEGLAAFVEKRKPVFKGK
jgi:enoyl-CoA hydratase/carnithine racemase